MNNCFVYVCDVDMTDIKLVGIVDNIEQGKVLLQGTQNVWANEQVTKCNESWEQFLVDKDENKWAGLTEFLVDFTQDECEVINENVFCWCVGEVMNVIVVGGEMTEEIIEMM